MGRAGRCYLPSIILFWNALRIPTSQGIVILEHSLKVFSSDRLSVFTQGFVKKPLGKGIIFRCYAFTEIESSGFILNGG
jgi:hypothetical protein